MRKRKITGLIPYGKRNTYINKVQKLQAGGYTGVSGGYNWREDPYELMLLNEKAKPPARRAARPVRFKPPKPVKPPTVSSNYKAFPGLGPGLAGSRKAAEGIYQQAIKGYQEMLKIPGAAASPEGMQEYQRIKLLHDKLDSELITEYKAFTSFHDKVKDDQQTLGMVAISSDGRMFVDEYNKKGEQVARNKFISKDEYLKNMGSYHALTLKDLFAWKANTDNSMRMETVEPFISGSVVGEKKFDALYIDKEKVQFSIDGHNIKSLYKIDGAQIDMGSAKQLQAAINNSLTGVQSDLSVIKGTQTDIIKAAHDLFGDLMSGNKVGHASRSLESEYLASDVNRAALLNAPEEDRADIMQNGISILLIKKLVDRQFHTDISKNVAIGKNAVVDSIKQLESTPTKNQFLIGSFIPVGIDVNSSKWIQERESVWKYPLRRNAFAYNASITADRKANDSSLNPSDNYFSLNPEVTKNIDMSRAYTLGGADLAKVLGTDLEALFSNRVVIAPGTQPGFTLLPTMTKGVNKDSPMMDHQWTYNRKITMREYFIKAYNSLHDKKTTLKAADLVGARAAGSAPEKLYREYLVWLTSVSDKSIATKYNEVMDYDAATLKDPKKKKEKDDAIRDYQMRNIAVHAVETDRKVVDAYVKKNGIVIRPWAVMTAAYENAWSNNDFHERIMDHASTNKASAGSRENVTIEGLAEVISASKAYNGTSVFDEFNTFTFLAPYRSASDIVGRTAAGGDTDKQGAAQNFMTDMLTWITEQSPLTSTIIDIQLQLYR